MHVHLALCSVLTLGIAAPVAAQAANMWSYFTDAEKTSLVDTVRIEGKDPEPLIAGFSGLFPPDVPAIAAAAEAGLSSHFADSGLCTDAVVAARPRPHPLMNDIRAGNMVRARQISRAFLVDADVMACGDVSRASIVLLETADGFLSVLPIPGGSETWLTLRQDLIGRVSLYMAVRLQEDCAPEQMKETFRIENSDVAERADLGPRIFGGYLTGRWTEQWQISACGHSFNFEMKLTADGKGGAYFSLTDLNDPARKNARPVE
ncbi:hypothetical protein KCG44_03245 [Pacificimonas sp. WHA3]|uniref:Uncharacterized protein n=1 Tax=Pacificimonas pallii TaxID=2827236 RepID=A0ABS6SCH1_9SPHN|nr:hypothetical protein [Pacificimonas pallii]MBV7255798.1 hypothetical protein [Pacificimonas pallii]